jgi:glycylpeptide N-tetradecanoyltransferase
MASESKPTPQAHVEEVVEQVIEDDGGSESGDAEAPEASASSSAAAPAAAAGGSKKKKKNQKKMKALKALIKAKTGGDDQLPQALVDEVLMRARQGSAPGGEAVDEETVRQTMEQLKVMDVLKGKTGLGGKNKKEMGEHKVGCAVPPAGLRIANAGGNSSGRLSQCLS